ncbi:glycosyltransferase family A protein [Alcaligenaceae bacterium B3P038]|nr:glycosyltransferase family A protein [Alcaligenaceae bacterium B3P038]
MSIAKSAISAYKEKNYKKALELFRQAAQAYGPNVFSANIRMCEKKLNMSVPEVMPSQEKAEQLIVTPKDSSVHVTVTPLATDYALQSLQSYRGAKSLDKNLLDDDLPLVSYVMTSHNAELTIENAIMSLVNQSYPKVEVVVCDDRSSDGTWEKLTRLAERLPKALRILRMECNGGTYLAKNAAISVAKGTIIMFQDSDDYSHPDRTTVQVEPLLRDANLIATRTKYCRFNPDSGRIVPVANTLAKYGLITLAVRSDAFASIGFFDAVRKAGDDEWFQRLQHLYGKNRVAQLDVALYLAELRSGSLIADMLTFNADGSVEQSSSKERKDYVKIFRSRFDDSKKRRDWYKQNFPATPLRPVDIYSASIASIASPEWPVYAALCSIPKRIYQLKCVVDRLLPQVDHLYVYLDKYDSTPGFLDNNKKITVYHSKNFTTDHRDNAKFIPFNELKKKGEFYYFTCDDDLIYPFDYVRALVQKLTYYENRVIVGLHGVVCEEKAEKYFKRRFIYHFKDQIDTPRLVNNLGTGTVAFHSSTFESIFPERWNTGGMVDIYFSNEALRRNVPMLCVGRHAGWLTENEMPTDNATLFGEFKDKEKLIVAELKQGEPWGYQSILRTLAKQDISVKESLQKLLPLFADKISVAEIFPRLR